MVSACKIGTPLLTSVPSVRVKREIATLLITGPTAGNLSWVLSQTSRPNLVLMNSRKATTAIAMYPIVAKIWLRIMLLAASTNRVNSGILTPIPANTS